MSKMVMHQSGIYSPLDGARNYEGKTFGLATVYLLANLCYRERHFCLLARIRYSRFKVSDTNLITNVQN